MKGKVCQNKILYICSFLVFCLSCLFSVFFSHPVNAVGLPINHFTVQALPPNGSSYSLISNQLYNQYIHFSGNIPPYAIKSYQFDSDAVNVTGNFATIHFETNFVFTQPTSLPYVANFVNRNYLSVSRCSVSTGESLTIRQQTIHTSTTEWTGPAPTINGKNKTLTVYGDVVLSGLSTGSKNFYCYITADPYAFYQVSGNNLPEFYIEQQPTSIDFTNDQSEALLQTQIEQNNTIINNQENINNSINDIEDSITDPTVEGDFTMPEIPAFGPIATIINNIIAIPQTIIGALGRRCTPLTGGPLPFTNQNITLPCFLNLMESLGLNTVVATIENLLAMYIWVRIAIYIVRSVKKLRDPENDDEEYLDI